MKYIQLEEDAHHLGPALLGRYVQGRGMGGILHLDQHLLLLEQHAGYSGTPYHC